MEYRPLGRTGLRVSVLGYGASPLGNVFGAVEPSEGIAAVRTALDLGVNFIDVSPYYGATLAETVLGRALRGVDRDSYVLATKVGRYGERDFDFSAARVVASVDESLARLGVEHIDLIQCHDIEFGDLDQVVEESIPALRGLQEKGKVRHIGVTGYPLPALADVAHRVPVDTVLSYCRYTLQDRALLEWTPFFAAHGTGIINASPLSMGLLSTRGAPDWHPAPAPLREYAARAAQLCRDRGTTIEQVAVRFAVEPEQFASTIVGSASPANMIRNVEWATAPLDHELVAELQELLGPVLNAAWPSGRPENSKLRSFDA